MSSVIATSSRNAAREENVKLDSTDIELPPFVIEKLQNAPALNVRESNPAVLIMQEPAHNFSPVHRHNTAEVMVVLSGKMLFMGTWATPGTVICVDAEHEYWHATGEEPCLILLIRPQEHGNLTMGADARRPAH